MQFCHSITGETNLTRGEMGFLRHFEEPRGILKRSLGRDSDLELMVLRVGIAMNKTPLLLLIDRWLRFRVFGFELQVRAASDILRFEIREEEEESDWTEREWWAESWGHQMQEQPLKISPSFQSHNNIKAVREADERRLEMIGEMVKLNIYIIINS